MKSLKPSSKFKKDLKKYQHQRDKLRKLKVVLDMLEKEEPIPDQYKPHKLMGDKQYYMECHIENDLLLIWKDPNTDVIYLARFGSHAEVLRK